jgi:signal transduction histidine kinase/CheY-like chemotaxis protein
MSIRKKTAIFVGVTFLILLASLILTSRVVVLGSFLDLEKQHSLRSTRQVITQFENTLASLSATARDWASWDETYRFIDDRNPQYIAENLTDATLINLNLNFMWFFDTAGRLVFAKCLDLKKRREIPSEPDIVDLFRSRKILFEPGSTEGRFSGVLLTSPNPALVALRPILKNDDTGPVRGTLMIGTYLDSSTIDRISNLTNLTISVCDLRNTPLPVDCATVRSSFSQDRQIIVQPAGNQTISGYFLQRDIFGDPGLIVKASDSRDISRHGRQTLNYFLSALIALALVFIVLILLFLEKIILTPLISLNRQLARIDSVEDRSQRIEMKNKDELGQLAKPINLMLDRISKGAAVLAETNARLSQEIAERRQIEQTLQRAHAELETRVHERTQELLDANSKLKRETEEKARLELQLYQTQKYESIGTLAGGIAHEFNNLLMTIQGNVSLMLFGLDAGHPHYGKLHNIEKAIQNGSALTSQLLGYARKGKYQSRTLDLNSVIRETAATFARTHKDIVVDEALAEDLSDIEADREQMVQVLFNLYGNAAEAMPDGGDLFLKTSNVTHEDIHGRLYLPKPGIYVKLSVSDTGIGMDRETQDRIFDPFFTTKKTGQGKGLGLASVYGIIKNHGGYIEVASEPGQGTTLNIYLPASSRKSTKTEVSTEDISRGTGAILLVDDEELVLEVGARMLEKLGYTVMTARGGKSAVDIYEKNFEALDLVILDLVMPDLGGSKAFDMIRRINPQANVLLSSGYSADGQASFILQRGCNGFIQKPFNLKELSEKIIEILGDERHL